jgi:hypothetical protein
VGAAGCVGVSGDDHTEWAYGVEEWNDVLERVNYCSLCLYCEERCLHMDVSHFLTLSASCAFAPGCRRRHLFGASGVILECVANRHDLNTFVEQHKAMLFWKERDSLWIMLGIYF